MQDFPNGTLKSCEAPRGWEEQETVGSAAQAGRAALAVRGLSRNRS